MNALNKKVRKAMRKLEIGKTICIPWAAIEGGGLAGRPEQSAYCGFQGRVYYMEPTDAGLRVTRHEDASLDEIKGAVEL